MKEKDLDWVLGEIQTGHMSRAEAREEVEKLFPEIVICAAVRAKDGTIYRGHRHGHALYKPFGLQGMPGYEGERPHGDDQGFITSRNRYVTREEAYRIFVESGAVSVDESRHPMAGRMELYSEDLY